MRYMFATNEGELYMLAFALSNVGIVQGSAPVSPQEANSFVIIEFMSSKLTPCSSLVYLDDGYVYYGSKLGNSFIIKLQTEHQGNKDMPYI